MTTRAQAGPPTAELVSPRERMQHGGQVCTLPTKRHLNNTAGTRKTVPPSEEPPSCVHPSATGRNAAQHPTYSLHCTSFSGLLYKIQLYSRPKPTKEPLDHRSPKCLPRSGTSRQARHRSPCLLIRHSVARGFQTSSWFMAGVRAC